MTVSNDGKSVVIVNDCVTKDIPSFSKACKKPYANNAPGPDDEVRFYDLDKDSVLEYDSSFNLNGWGTNAAFSPDDKKLAVTWAPVLINALIGTNTISLGAGVVTVYDSKGSKLSDARSAGTSPLSFGVSFNDEDQLLIAGIPTLLQSDIQLVSVNN